MIGKKIDQKIRKVQLFPLWYGLFRIQKCQIIKCSDQFLHPFRFVQRCCDPPVLFSGQCRCQKQLQMTGNNCQRRAQIMGDIRNGLFQVILMLKGTGYRVALFLPSITSTVAVSMVWLWIFNPDMGILNNILTAIGLNDVPLWLGDPAWSKPALVIMRVWQMSGYYMLMFLAGLQTIPETLYEAADVDGATGWQKFIRITVPMLSNTTFVVAILLVIEAFNMFESIFVMTKGGPLGSTSTIMYYIYEQGFTNYNMGYASALAWIFFALIMIVTLVQYRFRHEQGGE